MTGVGAPPPNVNSNPLDVSVPAQQPPGAPLAGVTPNPYQSLGYFTGFPEPIMFNAPKSQRSRRKSAPGLDHVKHRRTRSGCYTCRNRRVKVTVLSFLLPCGPKLTPPPSATKADPCAKVRPQWCMNIDGVMLTYDRVQERKARMHLPRIFNCQRSFVRELKGWNRP